MSFYPQRTPDLSKKKNAQIAHAQRRIKERLGEGIDAGVLARQIKRGESRFLFSESNRITHHRIEINGKPVEVVYDTVRKVVVTVLPLADSQDKR